MAEVTAPPGRSIVAGLLRPDPVWTVAILAAVAASLAAIFTLGLRPLWLDELFTLALASPQTSDADAWAIVTADVHPPLYFMGVRVWLDLWGTSSEWAARSFNLFFLVLAAFGAAWAARLKVLAPMALWIAFFFTSFGVLWYLQEARMYAGLIASAFLVCIVALAYEKVRAHPPTRIFLAAVAVAFAILPFTHWFAALFAGLVLFGLFIHAFIEKRRAYAVVFFLAGALLALLAGAWILQLWASTVGAIDGYDSGASMELWQLRQGAIGTLLFAFSLNPILMLAAAWAITGIVKEPASRPVLTLLVVCALVVPVLILLVSLHTPLNQTRNFAGFVGPATLFAAMGFQQIVQRLKLDRVRAAVALAGVLAGSLLIGLNADRYYPTLERDEWRTAGAYVRSLPGCDGATIPVSAQWERRPEGAAVGIPARVTTSMRMYGYYAGQPERLAPVYGDDNVLPPGAGEGACPIMLWIGHTTPEFADRRAQELAGAAYREMTRVDFAGNAVFVRRDMPTP